MPLFTPNFALPYPGGLDEPCQFAAQWCDFAKAFQGALNGFQATLDRTNPAIPMARILRTTPITLASQEPIPFDTLSVDTAGWVDFDASASSININRGGLFVIIGAAEVVTIAGTTDYSATVTMTTPTAGPTMRDGLVFAPSPANIGINLSFLKSITEPTVITMHTNNNNSLSNNLTRAALSVFWHADRSTP